MRRTLLALAFLAFALPGAAQPVQVLHSFDVPPSATLGGLVETPDGSLYGTTYYGGFGGTMFRLPPGGGAATIVARFERGRYPEGPLVLGPGGLIYGATRTGGVSDRGTVFRFDPATAALVTIHVFDGADDGALPEGRLVVAPDGLLYGVAEAGGGGLIYQIDPATGRTRTVHRFVDFGPLGYRPIGGLVGLPNGMLYGVLRDGGPPGSTGTLYRFDPATSTFQLVHAFLQTTGGWDPTSCLTLTRDGFLYGTTLRGGSENAGTIYRLDPTTGVVQTVYELQPLAHLDGRAPFTQLVEAADGSLYGTTFESSVTTAGGTIFRLRRPPAGGHVFTTIAHLDPAVIGRGVLTDLALASDGWIYGGTESGGSGAGGTVFRFDSLERGPIGDPIQLGVVHAFQTRETGWYPTAAPVLAADGFLYGMTGSGGAAGRGDVYRMDPATGATTSLGAAPLPTTDPATGFTRSSFVDGGDGSLYATVASYGQGLIVRVTLATGAVSTALSVTLPSFGSTFGVGLVRVNGHLYGVMDDAAGPTLYRFDPVSATITPVCLILSGSVSFFPPGVALAAGIDGRIYATVTTVTPVFRGVTYDTRLWRVDPVAATSVMLLGAFSVADTAAAARPDGSLAYASSSAVGAELRYIDPVSGTSRPGCVPTGYVSMRSLTAAADGSVLFVATSGIPVLRHAIFRCADGAATATRIHDFPLETRFISRLAPGAGGLVYGAADVGPLGGGTIFRLAASGTTPVLDTDADGLDDAWEAAAGLRASSAAGDDGPGGDPDGDGVTNLAEQAAGTHPRGFLTRYLAEGTTNAFFHTRLALVNGGTAPARVLLRFQTDANATIPYPILVPPTSRRTIDVETIPGLATASFSTVVESDVFVGVDRTMTWDASGYGSHTETAVAAPATTWYFAEGSTSGDFALFYLLQNPQATAVTASVRYLRPANQAPIERQYTLPPHSRTTIPVDADAALASTDVSAVVTATAPIIAERAMYFSRPGRPFGAGHASAGVTTPALEWFLAEGATGPFFDLFLLIANPNDSAASVSVDYLRVGGGVLTKAYTVPANGRFTVWVDDEQVPGGSGQRPLANAAVSMAVRSTNAVPVIVERTMWWPGPETTSDFWYEAHNSPGATSTALRWAVADAEIAGADGAETYVLIANPSATPGRAFVRLFFENGNTTGRFYDLPPQSRTNVAITGAFPEAIENRTLGAVVDSLGASPVPIVVEHATYASPGGVTWTRGSNALATPVP